VCTKESTGKPEAQEAKAVHHPKDLVNQVSSLHIKKLVTVLSRRLRSARGSVKSHLSAVLTRRRTINLNKNDESQKPHLTRSVLEASNGCPGRRQERGELLNARLLVIRNGSRSSRYRPKLGPEVQIVGKSGSLK
jgi:hypothetical protein